MWTFDFGSQELSSPDSPESPETDHLGLHATDRVLKRQLEAGLGSLEKNDFWRLTVAYEPVWAIGTGKVATVEQVADAHACIRKWIRSKMGDDAGEIVRILYGGSVKPDNVQGLMAIEDVDGTLVGGASMKPDTFIPIIEFDSLP